MNRIYLTLIPAFLLLSAAVTAQNVTATSDPIFVDYAPPVESTLEIIEPEYLATNSDTRGFRKIEDIEYVEIKGIATNESGIQSLFLNNYEISFSETGYFSERIALAEGDNAIHFKIIDKKNSTTHKEFNIYVEPKPVETIGKYYSLIIGVQDYDDDDINDLQNPVRDATALYDVLTTKYTFETANSILLKNPTADQIQDELDKLSEKITEKDNLLIFYAGHGHWDEEAKNGYWLPSDADDERKRDWLRNSTVTEYIREIKTKHTLLITDACFGGSIFQTRKAFKDADIVINELYDIPSRRAMTSGTYTEVPDNSVFMEYLLKNLNNNDKNHMASQQLYNKLSPAVIANGPIMNNGKRNIPQTGVMQNTGHEGGDFIFVKRTVITTD